jgi:hypothetical protein
MKTQRLIEQHEIKQALVEWMLRHHEERVSTDEIRFGFEYLDEDECNFTVEAEVRSDHVHGHQLQD